MKTTSKFLPHGKCKIIWGRSSQTADLAHWTSKFMNYFLLCSFVSNICKLLYNKSRTRTACYEREKCVQALLASVAEVLDDWDATEKNERSSSERKRQGWGSERGCLTKLVCEHNGCLGCELVTSACLISVSWGYICICLISVSWGHICICLTCILEITPMSAHWELPLQGERSHFTLMPIDTSKPIYFHVRILFYA